MATQVIGSIAINNLLPIQSRVSGSVAFGPVAVPVGYVEVTIVFDLQQVATLTAVFSATFELALDGVVFSGLGGVGIDLSKSGYVLNGGILMRPVGHRLGAGPVRTFAGSVLMPGSELSTRQLRGTVTASEAGISGVTLTAF